MTMTTTTIVDPIFEQLKREFLQQRWILIDQTSELQIGRVMPHIYEVTRNQAFDPNYMYYFSCDRMVNE